MTVTNPPSKVPRLCANTVPKLVLIFQACCDPRLKGSHRGVLAVIIDGCFNKDRSFRGPTAIGQIAGVNPRTARKCIKDLVRNGYLRTEPRTKWSSWYIPNFAHARATGRLVQRGSDPPRAYAPAGGGLGLAAGARPTGPARSSDVAFEQLPMRAPRPEEAVLEAVPETIKEAFGITRWRQQQPTAEERRITRVAGFRAAYLEAREHGNQRLVTEMETSHLRKVLEDLIVPLSRASSAPAPLLSELLSTDVRDKSH
jgi:hypothetical protein